MLQIEGSTKYIILEPHDTMVQAVNLVVSLERSSFFQSYRNKKNVISFLKSIYQTNIPDDKVELIMQSAGRAMNTPFDQARYESVINQVATIDSGVYFMHHQLQTQFRFELEGIVKVILKDSR